MKKIKVSVIVPVYNVDAYIKRCIESILSQSMSDLELILINDGSTDLSGTICDEYTKKDNRVKVIHKKNAGVSAARNTGLDEAIGEYIMFMDSDDYIDSTMIERMYAFKGDIVFSGIKFISSTGEMIRNHVINDFNLIDYNIFINDYLLDAMKNYITSGPCNKFFKKEIIKINNLKFDESISICEDGVFVFRYMCYCKTFSNVSQAFYNYVQYQHGNNLMSKFNINSLMAHKLLLETEMQFINLSDCLKKDVRTYIEQSNMDLMFNCFLQIYSRSQLTSKAKLKSLKEFVCDKTFRFLLKKYNAFSWKHRLVYIFFSLKLERLLHCLLVVKYGGEK